MTPLEVVRVIALVVHIVGTAAVIGPFLLQLRTRDGFRLGVMTVGAVVQIVSGNLLIASRRLQGMDVIDEKMIAKLAVAVLVLVAVIVANVVRRRARARGASDGRARPWVLAAGALAVVDVAIAVVWT